MVIFYGYVKLPEGMLWYVSPFLHVKHDMWKIGNLTIARQPATMGCDLDVIGIGFT